MSSYCLKCRKNIESKNPKIAKTKKGKNVAFIKMYSVGQKKIEIYQRARS